MKHFLAVILSVFACSAYAEPMVVDMTTVLIDQDGKVIKDQYVRDADDVNCDRCPPFTLGAACAHALFLVSADEKDVTAEQKWAWAKFADDIRNKSDVKLNSAQVDLLVKRLGKFYGGVILMRAIPLIDPNRKPPEIR
jgi:hypothetical protein